ncbi:unnamed protein product [Echinostoma caproni]|uniref:DPPIV_N domain-containing protein n=1 Tax=Echinostoma caproni TaxID=27848 RepID=A0A183AXB0_9TREM|nr:unnamed protein product [Echinostoma caproni]
MSGLRSSIGKRDRFPVASFYGAPEEYWVNSMSITFTAHTRSGYNVQFLEESVHTNNSRVLAYATPPSPHVEEQKVM